MNARGSDFWDQPSAPTIGPEQFNEIVTTAADLALVAGVGKRFESDGSDRGVRQIEC